MSDYPLGSNLISRGAVTSFEIKMKNETNINEKDEHIRNSINIHQVCDHFAPNVDARSDLLSSGRQRQNESCMCNDSDGMRL